MRKGTLLLALLAAGLAGIPALAGQGGSVATEDDLAREGKLDQGELTPFMQVTLAGDYVAAGTGLADRDEGMIVIDGIPEGAEVIGAVLYWSFADRDRRSDHRRLVVGGLLVEGEEIGSADTCRWGYHNYAFRAVLSREQIGRIDYEPLGPIPEVPHGNGTYVISGYPRGVSTIPLGATMVMVYEDDAEPVRDVVFFDGDMMPYVGPPPPFIHRTSQRISGFLAADPTFAHTTFVVGDGEANAPDIALFVSAAGRNRVAPTWSFNGDDGPHWDTDHLDLSGVIAPGETYGDAQIWVIGKRGPGGLYYFDCLNWIAQILSVTSQHEPDPDPAAAFR